MGEPTTAKLILKMVQYVITPWRNRNELFYVRKVFYPLSDVVRTQNDQERHVAVELVSVWVQRGNCPHAVESTAILVSAILNDAGGSSIYAVRAAYAAAFSRFVTGLLDGYQDKKHKLSMYSIAKNIGLPATFVELRHQCTHEELPSLSKLRAATNRSLLWIWDHYWKNLEESTTTIYHDELHSAVLMYLEEQTGSQPQEIGHLEACLQKLQKWNDDDILGVLMEISDASITKPGVLRQALKLSRVIMSGEKMTAVLEPVGDIQPSSEREVKSLKEIEADAAKAAEILQEEEAAEGELNMSVEDEQDVDDDETGWGMWKGLWVPKPIGVV